MPASILVTTHLSICNTDSKQLAFFNEDEVESVYKPELEKCLKENIAGADEDCLFNWRLRANRRTATVSQLGNIHRPVDLLVPAHFVHLDQTLKTAIEYTQEHMGSGAEYLLRGRLRIFKCDLDFRSSVIESMTLTLNHGIWKPIGHPLYDCSRAVCGGSTVREQDLLVCDNFTKAKVGELMLPMYNKEAKWYYLHH